MRCSVKRWQQQGSNTDGRSAVGGRAGAGALRAPDAPPRRRQQPAKSPQSKQNLPARRAVVGQLGSGHNIYIGMGVVGWAVCQSGPLTIQLLPAVQACRPTGT